MQVTDKISLQFVDRMQAMKPFIDKAFDCAVLDPEFGIKESSKNHESRNTPVIQKNGLAKTIKSSNYEKADWDDSVPNQSFFDEAFRVSKNQIIFGGNYFECLIGKVQKPPRRNEYEDFLKKNPRGWIIWDKMNGSNDFSDCEVIYTSFDFPSYVVYFMWNGMMQGIYCGTDYNKANVQQGDKSLNEKRIHPTQKPVPIYKYLFSQFLNPDDLILDTGFGSGSIAIACFDFGLRLIGCENNRTNYLKAINRVNEHIAFNQSLFKPEELLTPKLQLTK